MKELGFRLCYVKGPWAYFFDGEPTDIWGDDWNDTPYECNAGPPYSAPHGDPSSLAVVAWDGDFVEPADGHFNSPFSVDDINRGIIPWLRNKKQWIWAGTTLRDFIDLVEDCGGTVYMACSTLTTNKSERRPYAGKLGPWARGECHGIRYLDIGTQDKPEYARIISAEKSLTWHWVRVEVEGVYGTGLLLRWCGCNIYE